MHCNMKYPKILYILQEYGLTVATLSPSKCHNETCRGVIRHHVAYTLNRGNFISYRLKLHVESANHHCTDFSGDLMLPTKWRDLLACRSCKKELTEYVADEMLTLVQRSLRANQTFVANIKQ